LPREWAGERARALGGADWNGIPWMIVCSCNVITMAEVRRIVRELHAGPEPKVITPGVVYKALGHRPQCGCCLGTVAKTIEQSLEGCCGNLVCTLKS
jgi:bacterioferritin-associated ferredoxin